jgi:magnesium-transporting ATPase (P-type)
MDSMVSFIISAVTLFAVLTGAREIILYRKYVSGELQYLVSKERRNRRLIISSLLVAEAVLLFLGFFVFSFHRPWQALLYWAAPLILVGFLVYLSVLDFRETTRDIDQIFQEASQTILRKVKENLSAQKK